ncbi:MAG: S41 family peptidase [Chitinophagaceae bacterium]|nr:S41 family peptidase [Chitinophagaceae bacterium]
MKGNKLQIWLPLLFSLVLIVGMILGYQMSGYGTKDLFSVSRKNTLMEIVELVKQKYVDPIPDDSLESGAIAEIISRLDPHSVYLTPFALKEANEELQGNFQGIGIEFNLLKDTVNVLYVIPGSPGEKAGILPGDKIYKVNDSVISGKGLKSDDIKKLIKGPSGTTVNLAIYRENKSLQVSVTRGNIPVPAVDASYLISKNIGYIKLNRFSEKAYEEFMKATEDLQKEGMQKLILDLRGNGGGLLEEAVDIADEFLDADKRVVSMKGAHSPSKEYRCKRPGILEKTELVVLVDEQSASASEVLAGALQDWCRAKIVGRQTFGKGLVQQQYNLSNGGALRLTTARYYTPSGRSIQRPYEKGKFIEPQQISESFQQANRKSQKDSALLQQNKRPFVNTCNDTLYEGGGITPDIIIPADTTIRPEMISRFLTESNANYFIYQYFTKHQKELEKIASLKDFTRNYPFENLWKEYMAFVQKDTALSLKKLRKTEQEQLLLRLKAGLARFMWRNNGFFYLVNETDRAIRKAEEMLQE